MFEGSNALTFVQGDVWSGGGFNIAPSLDLGDALKRERHVLDVVEPCSYFKTSI